MPDSHAEYSAEILLERQRLARDLHDTVAQSLAAVGYGLDEVVGDQSLSLRSKRALRSHRLELSRIIDELRIEIHRLRSSNHSTLLSWIELRAILKLESDQAFSRLPVHEELGHLLLELLNNAASHQSVASASLSYESGVITATFTQFKEEAKHAETNKQHFGQVGIRERLEILGASLESTASGFLLRLGPENG